MAEGNWLTGSELSWRVKLLRWILVLCPPLVVLTWLPLQILVLTQDGTTDIAIYGIVTLVSLLIFIGSPMTLVWTSENMDATNERASWLPIIWIAMSLLMQLFNMLFVFINVSAIPTTHTDLIHYVEAFPAIVFFFTVVMFVVFVIVAATNPAPEDESAAMADAGDVEATGASIGSQIVAPAHRFITNVRRGNMPKQPTTFQHVPPKDN